MLGVDLVGEVSIVELYVVEFDGLLGVLRFIVVVLDFGIKINILCNFVWCGICCYVLLVLIIFEQIVEFNLYGVFLFNGFGDLVIVDYVVVFICEVLGVGILLFGICFGNQILGCVLGLLIYKMVFGYCGINILVVDYVIGWVVVIV